MTVHTSLAALPSHLPDDLVFNFDPYAIPGLVDGFCGGVHALWKTVKDSYPDLFCTPRSGGH